MVRVLDGRWKKHEVKRNRIMGYGKKEALRRGEGDREKAGRH